MPALERAAAHAIAYLDGLDRRPVGVAATADELRAALDRPLPEAGTPDERVVDELVRDADAGLLGSAGGRFFGWVIGGGVPAALAADWLTSAWDQNAALYACSPAEAVIEEVAGRWLKELLGLPSEASFAFTTGTQMAHVTALAAARHRLLAARGYDVGRRGLAGAPPIRVVTGGEQHASVDRAVRLLGLGTDAIEHADLASLSLTDEPTIVCLQAGEINTGAFDPFAGVCREAREHGAWVHVDGAFGLWAAVSERYAPLVAGAEQADSWTTDAHKWLNVPFDCGFAFIRDAEAHRAAMQVSASYLITSGDGARDQLDWNPEWSRRGRGVPVYAAIRALGRNGIRALVEGCADHARRLVAGLGALPGAEVLAEPILNQGLVGFGDDTDAVVARVQAGGEAWFGATTYRGVRAMRVSVVNWRTTAADVDRAVAAVRAAL
jgi:glutamate/tyrosine decarboxylase-like PLP-dependent enzyme